MEFTAKAKWEQTSSMSRNDFRKNHMYVIYASLNSLRLVIYIDRTYCIVINKALSKMIEIYEKYNCHHLIIHIFIEVDVSDFRVQFPVLMGRTKSMTSQRLSQLPITFTSQ